MKRAFCVAALGQTAIVAANFDAGELGDIAAVRIGQTAGLPGAQQIVGEAAGGYGRLAEKSRWAIVVVADVVVAMQRQLAVRIKNAGRRFFRRRRIGATFCAIASQPLRGKTRKVHAVGIAGDIDSLGQNALAADGGGS